MTAGQGPLDPREERTVEELLDELATGVTLAGGEDDATRRAYLELFGLVPAALDPVEPPPALRAELLRRVRSPSARRPSAVVPLERPEAAGSFGGRPWLLPIAAALIVVLTGFSGWQFFELGRQRQSLGEMARRLEDLQTTRLAMGDLRSNLALVTSPGVEVCTLKPVEAALTPPGSRGVLFVAADHQHWYLAVEGLEPCREGRSYQLWFELQSGETVSAGTFDVRSGVRVELSSDRMPAGTRAVIITLEPAGGSSEPSGPRVLHGDEVMRIL